MNFQILAIGYRFVFLFKLIKNERLEIEWENIFKNNFDPFVFPPRGGAGEVTKFILSSPFVPFLRQK
jgi:hypothetical protein